MSDPNVHEPHWELDHRGAPVGMRATRVGADVSFPPGPDGAHRISNPGADSARVLVVSTIRPEVAEHVSTGATRAMTGSGQGNVFPRGTEQDLLVLYQAAIAADQRLDDSRAQ